MGPTIAGFDDEDDGYVSPDFDLPSESESEHEVPPPKRQRSDGKKTKTLQPTTLEEEEELDHGETCKETLAYVGEREVKRLTEERLADDDGEAD